MFSWSSKTSENSIGAEYIIMEKIEGVPLRVNWDAMAFDKKVVVVRTLAKYQKAWMAHTFNQYGSLYYAGDAPASLGQPTFSYCDENSVETQDKRFVIGPTVHRHTIDFGRAQVDFYRGPCMFEHLPLYWIKNKLLT